MMLIARSFDEYETEAVHPEGPVLQYFNTIAVGRLQELLINSEKASTSPVFEVNV
jgi:hypothetical protein